MVQEFPRSRTVGCFLHLHQRNTTKISCIPGFSSYLFSSSVPEHCIKVYIAFRPKGLLPIYIKRSSLETPPSGSRAIYLLLALYASSTATTSLVCVFQVLRVQIPETHLLKPSHRTYHCYQASPLIYIVQLYTVLLDSLYYGCRYGHANSQTREKYN